MILSGTLATWSLGYQSQKTATLYLGATSVSDIWKATHKAAAYIGPPAAAGNLFSVGFDEAKALPVPPVSVSASMTQGGGQYYDPDVWPILAAGSALGTTGQPSSLTLDLVYGASMTFTGVNPSLVSGFQVAPSQTCALEIRSSVTSTLTASVSGTKLSSASDLYSGWGLQLSGVGDLARVVISTSGSGYTTFCNCLPLHNKLSGTAVPDYGVLLDPITGSTTFLSNLSIDVTAIQSVDVG